MFAGFLQTAKHVLGLPIGQHVMISCKDAKGEETARPYTPVRCDRHLHSVASLFLTRLPTDSSDDDVGHIDLVIKIYFRGVNEKFPDGGVMSQYMESLKLGDSARVQLLYFPMPLLLIRNNHVVQLMFQGPKGKYTYKGRGTFGVKRLPSQVCVGDLNLPKAASVIWLPRKLTLMLQGGGEELRKCRRIGMIAGGTGITPMLQIINAVLKDQGDKTEVPRHTCLHVSAIMRGHLTQTAPRSCLYCLQTRQKTTFCAARCAVGDAATNVLAHPEAVELQELEALAAKHSKLKVR